MRRIAFIALASLIGHIATAQTTDTTIRKPILKPNSVSKSNDHLMLQLGYTTWQGQPDSIRTGGLPRTFNLYFLFDFPFKTNPNWSVAVGAGVASDNVFFDKMSLGIRENTTALSFRNLADTNHFKKYKLTTTYLEAPVELRFSSNPEDNRKSFKVAIGAKIGTLVGAGVKGKNLQNKAENKIGDYTIKEKSKRYFNTNRLSATARVGYGHFSLFGSYAITPLFKEGLGPAVRPLTLGITLSGL